MIYLNNQMKHSLINKSAALEDLKAELLLLQNEYSQKAKQLSQFENFLREKLNSQLVTIRELEAVYKAEKRAKKDKRIQQKLKNKKSGTTSSFSVAVQATAQSTAKEEIPTDIKKLYREALQNIHPDKFAHNTDHAQIANEITTELIQVYQNNDFDRLKDLHELIIYGNILELSNQNTSVESPKKDTLESVQKEIETLQQHILVLQNSQLYLLMIENEDVQKLLETLKTQFEERIQVLLKRTRKSRK